MSLKPLLAPQYNLTVAFALPERSTWKYSILLTEESEGCNEVVLMYDALKYSAVNVVVKEEEGFTPTWRNVPPFPTGKMNRNRLDVVVFDIGPLT